MTREEFSTGFDRLTEAFNVTNAERKARIYFDELELISGDIFLAIVNRLVRQADKFPTISAILKTKEAIEPMGSEMMRKEYCLICDGYGWILTERGAGRANCIHGMKLSAKIQIVEISASSKESNAFDQFKEMAISNPERMTKGFSLTYRLMMTKNPKFYQDCREFLLELVGKDRAKQILNAVQKEGVVKSL